MKFIDEILLRIEACIRNNEFVKLENEKIELKDNSHSGSGWNEVFKTVNAFLNTDGGALIIGIKEDERKKLYTVTGFNTDNEEKLKSIADQYKDDGGADKYVGEHIKYETRQFFDKTILIVYVDALADDEKYVFFNGEARERKITGDHKIPRQKIDSQKEYRAELIDARELKILDGAILSDLDVNRLNDFIQLLNSEFKTENIKANIEEAVSFLTRQSMLREGKPTLLGLLVCGAVPGEKLHFRSQVDAYVEAAGQYIAQDKKVINNTVLQLMEQSVAFVYRNIQTGISADKGGTKVFEYPERLIRECINNSLAHRDYTLNHFVSISIVPGKHIQIRNPGRFKQQLLIHDIGNEIPVRRIISGNSKANNPKLAKVLSVYNKWEGKGYGMATLTGACLDDKIDIPYYTFHSTDELSLIIPKGRLIDDNMEALFESYSGYIRDRLDGDDITVEQKRILAYFYKSEFRNKEDRYTILLTKDNNHLQAIQSLEDSKLIYRHTISNEIYPVFIIDRTLFQSNFKIELRRIFGDEYNELQQDYKEVISFIFERNQFALKKFPSANEVGGKLWIRKGLANILEGYEVYKRKVRNIINKLEKGTFILRHDGKPEYKINTAFIKQPDLFR